MWREKVFRVLMVLQLLAIQATLAQNSPKVIPEEESAEVFLEEYTDEFQEKFFEALKQKSIQNYDRAINLLLECRQLDANSTAVEHELAKTYFLDKKYIPAQQYAVEALISEPGNFWFLFNLYKIAQKQGIPFQNLENTIPYTNTALKGNLVKIYFQNRKYKEAKQVLRSLEMNQELSLLAQKIEDSLNKAQKNTERIVTKNTPSPERTLDSELERFRNELKSMASTTDHPGLEVRARKALETYPLQPEFYYFQGLALNRMERYLQAVGVLEEGLEYLFGNDLLANDFYKELAMAHKAIGNTSKANLYLSKVKPGF